MSSKIQLSLSYLFTSQPYQSIEKRLEENDSPGEYLHSSVLRTCTLCLGLYCRPYVHATNGTKRERLTRGTFSSGLLR